MKKLTTIFGAFLIASVVLTSCGGSELESDIKKACELKCVMDGSGNFLTSDAATEFHNFRKELGSKYDGSQLAEINNYMFNECECK